MPMPSLRARAGLAIVHRLAFPADRPGIRLDDAVDDLHQRRLAGAVLAQHRVDLAGQHVEVDAVVGDDAGIGLGDAFELRAVRMRGQSGITRRLPLPRTASVGPRARRRARRRSRRRWRPRSRPGSLLRIGDAAAAPIGHMTRASASGAMSARGEPPLELCALRLRADEAEVAPVVARERRLDRARSRAHGCASSRRRTRRAARARARPRARR